VGRWYHPNFDPFWPLHENECLYGIFTEPPLAHRDVPLGYFLRRVPEDDVSHLKPINMEKLLSPVSYYWKMHRKING
jgi:hypothetical protein